MENQKLPPRCIRSVTFVILQSLLFLVRPSSAWSVVGPHHCSIRHGRPAPSLVCRPPRRPAFLAIGAQSRPDDDDDEEIEEVDLDEEPDDIPENWTEQDILAELGDDVAEVAAAVIADDDDSSDPIEVDIDGPVDTELDATMEEDDVDADLDEIELALDEEDDEDEDEDLMEESPSYDDVVWEDGEDDMLQQATYFQDEWDEDEDGGSYELVDDLDDPNYMKQKELAEEAIRAAEQRQRDEDFDALEFLTNEMTDQDRETFEQSPFLKQVEGRARNMVLVSGDVETLDLDREVAQIPDLMDDDPYPRHDMGEPNLLERDIGLTDDDMEELDMTYKTINRRTQSEPWDKVMVKEMAGLEGLSNQNLEEMELALEELGGSAYNVTRWLLYDLDFNVTNLILAAVKINRDAPILLQHWFPQIATYERYRHARERDFDFNWDDVETADISELQRYYAGFGYDDIPKRAPAETGIIGFEEMDEEEIKMAAFENWMTDVYNPESDRVDFDDDDMRDEENVFSEFYEAPQHPDLPTIEDAEEDIDSWNDQLDENENIDTDEVRSYRDMMGKKFQYDVVEDEEFQREFRGHLVIACSGYDMDLEVAERITRRFEKEFEKKVFVETRVMPLAREDDNVFEIWLESYEIDLLHSKKRATSNTKDWQGPAECDTAQIDYLVDRVRFLISNDARYSYRMELEYVD